MTSERPALNQLIERGFTEQSGEWPRGGAPPCSRRQLTAPGNGSDAGGEDRRWETMLGEVAAVVAVVVQPERSGVSL